MIRTLSLTVWEVILKSIAQDVKSSRFYAILADEVSDLSGCSLVLLFVVRRTENLVKSWSSLLLVKAFEMKTFVRRCINYFISWDLIPKCVGVKGMTTPALCSVL